MRHCTAVFFQSPGGQVTTFCLRHMDYGCSGFVFKPKIVSHQSCVYITGG